MKRAITAFEVDAEGDPVARLACGHRQHVRHDPPLAERPWVLTPEGREARIGTPLDCVRCDRLEMPDGFAPYRRTPEMDQASTPKALRGVHTTKAGVWGRILVFEGALDYELLAPFDRRERLTPERSGTIPPEVPHRVSPAGTVRFVVEFWKAGS